METARPCVNANKMFYVAAIVFPEMKEEHYNEVKMEIYG
jgi:hypothetical protein